MAQADEHNTSSRSSALLSVPIAVEALVLGWFVLLLCYALQSGFRGGRFIVTTLLIGAALALVTLLRDVVLALASDARADAVGTGGSSQDDGAPGAHWPTVLAAFATMGGIFLCVVLLGTLLGLTLASWIILIWQSKLEVFRALVGALAIGVLLPVVFANILDLNLWQGLLPQIVPNWIGGGFLPPL